MNTLIQLFIFGIIFCAVATGIWWLCVKFGAPQPVQWIAGAVLILILLIFLAQQVGLAPNGHLIR